MRQMQPILWTKGLLISPQHLQVQDRFLEDTLAFRLSSHMFCPWGFRRLEVDAEALAGGSFALSSGSGIFADGLLFDFPASDAPPPPKPLDEFWEGDRTSLDLYLGVPELRPGGSNVSMDRQNGSTRYLADDVLRRDENTGFAERHIQVARKNFRILTDAEILDGHTVLPAARVLRASTGELSLDARFVPPVIDIEASPFLMTVARRLLELLTAKSATLSGMRRERRKGLADFGVSDIAHFWFLYTVNSSLLGVRHIYETRHGHPEELYEAMLSLAGALTTFSTSIRPVEMPRYDHADLAACFTLLDEKLRTLLETVIPANHVTLPLKATEQPSVHATAIDRDRYLDATAWYLAIRTDLERTELIEKVPTLVKLSSGDRMDRLIRQAVPGMDLRHAPNPPSSLPLKLDYDYFELDRTGADWDAIRKARSLAAYVPAEFRNPRLELVITLPPED